MARGAASLNSYTWPSTVVTADVIVACHTRVHGMVLALDLL
jgi:hypothetical protein